MKHPEQVNPQRQKKQTSGGQELESDYVMGKGCPLLVMTFLGTRYR